MQASEEELDDLTKITGVGPVRQLWLAETFGVRTYADLASLSTEEIETKLEADRKPHSRSEVEGWLKEAAELAAEASSSPTLERDVKKRAPFEESNPLAEKDGWETLAIFIVAFQSRQLAGQPAEQRTTVNYHDIDQEVIWPGIERESICPWIFEQAGDKLTTQIEIEKPAKIEATPEAVAPAARVTVSQVRVFQPTGVESSLLPDKSGKPYLGTVRAGQAFDLEVILEANGQARGGNGLARLQVQFHARHRTSGDYAHLGDTEPQAIKNRSVYSAMLSQVSLPQGSYRLQILVLAQPGSTFLGYREIPIFRAE